MTAYGQPLTPREHQILHQFTLGGTHEETAARLGIDADTVRAHTTAVLRKLGARNRAHAVFLGYRSGLLGAEVDRRYGGVER